MPNYFKRYERKSFVLLSLLTVGLGIAGVVGFSLGWPTSGKLLTSCGLLSTLTGVVQLEISGLFDRIFKEYGNEEKYPYGPPSYVTREIIDGPDDAIRTKLRNAAFFNASTGFWLIVAGTLVQVAAVWV
jgi:hypothetical protein